MSPIKIHCLMRSGSTFIQKFFTHLCNLEKIKIYTTGIMHNFKGEGCVCPIRAFPTFGTSKHYNEKYIDNLTQYIVQIRDPRDVLTSQYYYFYNCVVQNEYKKRAQNLVRSVSIDDYVKSDLGAKLLIERHCPLFKIINEPNITFITYEDMVLNFKQWVNVSTKPFKLTNIKNHILYKKFNNDFLNIKETSPLEIKKGFRKSHKRKVYPGDYKSKLSNNTIKYVNEQFKDIIDFMKTIVINYNY